MESLSIFFFAVLFRSLHAQGLLGERNPRASPQQPPNATVVNGDIGLTRYQEAMRKLGPVSFNAIIGQDMRWKDGIIPYVIDCSLENMPNAVASIKAAIAQWERKTCIRFANFFIEAQIVASVIENKLLRYCDQRQCALLLV